MVEATSQPADTPQPPDAVVIRYGVMGHVGEFRNAPRLEVRCGAHVVIETDRGMEIGQMVSPVCNSSGCSLSVTRAQIRDYVKQSGPENCKLNAGKILRPAEPSDLDEAAHINRDAQAMKDYCQKRADEMKLGMRVIDIEHIFGGERAIFYFESENRVDFRGLVKDLAHEYQTRIEMRQIGARDEARLLADYEICGRQCCCKNFLKNLKPVNMRMAKTQKATLDPGKVSGRCGRLRCCLRYENEVYDELDRKLPKINARVRVGEAVGRVVDRQILTQLLIVQTEDGKRVAVPAEDADTKNVDSRPPKSEPQPRPAEAPQNEAKREASDEQKSGDKPRRRRRRRGKGGGDKSSN